MQAIIIQPEIQAAAVPTTSCSLIRRFTGGNALAKQSLTTYRLRCKAVDCCETLHHRIIDWQRMSMCTCWCCLIRFSCRRIRLADVVTTTSRLLGRNCHTMRMGTITLSSTGMGMGRHFTDGAIWPSVNYLLITIQQRAVVQEHTLMPSALLLTKLMKVAELGVAMNGVRCKCITLNQQEHILTASPLAILEAVHRTITYSHTKWFTDG